MKRFLVVVLLFGASADACVWSITNDMKRAILIVDNSGKALVLPSRKTKKIDTTIPTKYWAKVERYLFKGIMSVYFEGKEDGCFGRRYKLTERYCKQAAGAFKISEIGRNTPNVVEAFKIKTYKPRVIKKVFPEEVPLTEEAPKKEVKKNKKKK